jgi:hypothetical protein
VFWSIASAKQQATDRANPYASLKERRDSVSFPTRSAKGGVEKAKRSTTPAASVTTRPDFGQSCEIADEPCHDNSERPSLSARKATNGSLRDTL